MFGKEALKEENWQEGLTANHERSTCFAIYSDKRLILKQQSGLFQLD